MTVDDPSSFVQGLEDKHTILFYDSPENKKKILYSYLVDGLSKNKGVVYVRSESTKESISEDLRMLGVDVDVCIDRGQLHLVDYYDFYIVNGKVEPMRIVSRWFRFIDEFNSKGYGMRAVGETDCFFKEKKVRDLTNYEYTIRRVPSFLVDALCLYNIRTIVETGYTDMIIPLVRAHGKAIFTSNAKTMVMDPERVKKSDLENLMKRKI